MTALSPSETLTAAAKLLRERATAATPGPWIVHQANGFVRVDQPGPPSKAWTEKSGADLAEENRSTAEYIALMHPGVGLALARVLEQAAEALEGQDVPEDEPVLTLARQLLGEVAK